MAAMTITAALADLRDVPLADLPDVDAAVLDRALSGVMPDPAAVVVPVAAFSSAI